ncbi:MAG: ABC transporter permease, partial [Actinomycetota bacterium]|nr:ABC transporter permease [Actinomycetota bacterium]
MTTTKARARSGAAARDTTARILAPLAFGALVLAVWQSLVTFVGVDDYLLPSPFAIGSEIGEFWPTLVSAGVLTGTNAAVGLVVGSVVGILLALLASASRVVDSLAAPVVAALAVVPIVALAPVLNSMYGADSQV